DRRHPFRLLRREVELLGDEQERAGDVAEVVAVDDADRGGGDRDPEAHPVMRQAAQRGHLGGHGSPPSAGPMGRGYPLRRGHQRARCRSMTPRPSASAIPPGSVPANPPNGWRYSLSTRPKTTRSWRRRSASAANRRPPTASRAAPKTTGPASCATPSTHTVRSLRTGAS